MKEEEEEQKQIILEIKSSTSELSKLIIQRNDDLEVSLFQTLESTLEMLHIFIVKIWNHDILTTIVTASLLLSSIVRTLVTRLKHHDFSRQTLLTADRFTDMIQRMKYLIIHEPLKADKQNFKLSIVTHLHQVVNSLLYIFSTDRQSFSMMTPPHTPNSATFHEEDSLPHLNNIIVKNSNTNSVSKRFMRSISSLKKSKNNNNNHFPFLEDDRKHRTKIDEERPHDFANLLLEPSSNTKNTIKGFFIKKQDEKPPLKDMFETEKNSVTRSSVNTLVSPFNRNTMIRTSNDETTGLTPSDSGCFTLKHATSLTCIQKEFAEPVFVKRKQLGRSLKHNRSENDLKKHNISSILKPWAAENNQMRSINTNDAILRQASQKGEGSILHMSENGTCILIMEMSGGKLQMISGTLERLFMKLADESAQDFDFVDTYIQSHLFFTNSAEFLENLMARFHLEALPGDYEYFRKWQRCIQVKVLNVISRWIKLQFQDFESNRILITRLEAFLNGDVNRAGFKIESDMIKEALDRHVKKIKVSRHEQLIQASQSLVSFGNSINGLKRRPSITPSFLSSFSTSSYSNTPPDSPTYPPSCNDLLSFDTKDVARYLTLADFMLLKCITMYDYLTIYFEKRKRGDCTREYDYINMMTERANRLSKWVVYEISNQKIPKCRRNTIRKMIDIAKHCLNLNNFHTSMIITIGINQIRELQDDNNNLESLLPSKDYQTFKQLLRNLDVCNNMRYYRHAFKKNAKAPCVPFFPLILKDFTFLMDGNPTFLQQQQQQQREGSKHLVNFTKFRSLTQLAHSVLNYTTENYYFAGELDYFPFFPNQILTLEKSAGPLNQVAEKIESRIRNCK